MFFGSGRGRGFGGGSMRVIIGLIIAAVGLFTYYSRTQKNPVTGEDQRVALSVDQEKALGLQAAPEMAAKMGGALDPARNQQAALVRDIGQRLVQKSDAATSPYRDTWGFHLLADDQTVNAFALPGGQIFITKALLDRLENEAQLAGVLGHEIGHVINRHSAEQMAKGQLGQSMAAAVGVAASDSQGGGGAYVAAAMANQMLQLRYGRQDELESDNYGLKYMAQAGYDPSQMVRVMEILKQASGGSGRGPSFMQTHPNPDDRVKHIKEWVAQNYPNGIPATLTQGSPPTAGGDRFDSREGTRSRFDVER